MSVCVQCVVKEDKSTGKRVVAGTHWDFDSYGGTIKKQLGMPTQARSCDLVIAKQLCTWYHATTFASQAAAFVKGMKFC